ncbi:MAG: protein-disulfide reductase DsbD family protein [Nitrospira sp.]
MTVTIVVSPHFHINANKPTDPDLIGTAFQGRTPAGVRFGAARFPTPRLLKLAGSSKPSPVYTGRTVITVPVHRSADGQAGTRLSGRGLTYQGCNENSCYPPMTIPVQTPITVK